jgi:hypothetical protein
MAAVVFRRYAGCGEHDAEGPWRWLPDGPGPVRWQLPGPGPPVSRSAAEAHVTTRRGVCGARRYRCAVAGGLMSAVTAGPNRTHA